LATSAVFNTIITCPNIWKDKIFPDIHVRGKHFTKRKWYRMFSKI